jgi:hypothetical protein
MVRNVTLNQESDQIELRKGIQQNLVDSKKSNVKTTLSAEVFEFSAQNVFYSLSIGNQAVALKRGKLKTAAAGATGDDRREHRPAPGRRDDRHLRCGDIPNGATVLLQIPGNGQNDYVLPVRVTAATTVAARATTPSRSAIPAGMNFPVGTKVWVVNEIGVASTAEQDFFKVKVVGTLSNNERPVTLILPKVKITKGFQIQFDEGNYTSMPFEFAPYFLAQSRSRGAWPRSARRSRARSTSKTSRKPLINTTGRLYSRPVLVGGIPQDSKWICRSPPAPLTLLSTVNSRPSSCLTVSSTKSRRSSLPEQITDLLITDPYLRDYVIRRLLTGNKKVTSDEDLVDLFDLDVDLDEVEGSCPGQRSISSIFL